MSQHSELDSEIAESLHRWSTKYHSDDAPIALTIEDNESDHETTDCKSENVFDGIHYPAPHQWEHTYL